MDNKDLVYTVGGWPICPLCSCAHSPLPWMIDGQLYLDCDAQEAMRLEALRKKFHEGVPRSETAAGTGRRYSLIPGAGRPPHACSDGYPLVVNMHNAPYACVECLQPCDHYEFYYSHDYEIPCELRHAGRYVERSELR